MADITYCGHYECTAKECMRHPTRAPAGRYVSMTMFDCPYMPLDYFDGYELVVHAHWKKEVEDGMYWYVCSACGGDVPKTRYKTDLFSSFCPYCGAKMDEEVADG